MKSFVNNINSFKKKLVLNNNITKDSLTILLFNLLINTHIRVGNEIYALKNKTYGLTTLRQKHLITHSDGSYSLSFVGKSSIKHSIDIPMECSGIIKKLVLPKSPGNSNKPLFYYFTDKMNTISSEELNQFLKKNMGEEYTCKDFRTYSANILFIKAFLKNSKNQKYNAQKTVIKSIEYSAKMLGHTRNICKKSYISDSLLNYCLDSFNTASLCSPSVLLTKVWSP